jgi:hypothetical protein
MVAAPRALLSLFTPLSDWENLVLVEDDARNTFRAFTVPSDKIAIGDRVFLSADVAKAFVFPCSGRSGTGVSALRAAA